MDMNLKIRWEKPQVTSNQESQGSSTTEVATFGAGCFWCVEAVFEEVEGVLSVKSGYSGGASDNPTYEEICSGTSGHAEVCQIHYDPAKVSYEELLEVFWKTHDPTTLNRQGNDAGTQYRSVIFYHDDRQRAVAEKQKQALATSGVWEKPLVTEISPLSRFYGAEGYHQNYYERNPGQPYCISLIRPKMGKFRKVFKHKLKKRRDQAGSDGQSSR